MTHIPFGSLVSKRLSSISVKILKREWELTIDIFSKFSLLNFFICTYGRVSFQLIMEIGKNVSIRWIHSSSTGMWCFDIPCLKIFIICFSLLTIVVRSINTCLQGYLPCVTYKNSEFKQFYSLTEWLCVFRHAKSKKSLTMYTIIIMKIH